MAGLVTFQTSMNDRSEAYSPAKRKSNLADLVATHPRIMIPDVD
jgi:hypothetical protein